MFATNRQGVHFSLGSTFLFDEMPSFRDTLTLPPPRARGARSRDPRVRDQLRTELADPTRAVVRVRVGGRCASSRCTRPSTSGWLDRSVTEIADADRASIRSTRSSTSRSPRTSRRSSCVADAAERRRAGRDRDA